MEDNMFDDVSDIRRTRKKYNLQMFRSGINTFREFEEVEAHAFQDGALARKYKELIGMALGIANGCHG
jgi:alkylhydroperoxidase/carboxymuconolactone decarboxylase family protein YurZ